MKVEQKEYRKFLQSLEDKNVPTLERGGNYHDGYDIDTYIIVDKEHVVLASYDPDSTDGPAYYIYPERMPF